MLRSINNWIVIIVILCSTTLYKFSALASVHKVVELLGVVLILALIILQTAYGRKVSIKRNFLLPVSLMMISLVTSMVMANLTRSQGFAETLVAQRAIYYYLFYLLLHQMRIKPADIQKIFVGFGVLYFFLYLVQFFLYPTILFDAYVRLNRGTVRIYLPGTDYMFITFFFCVQWFFRTNRLKYLIPILSVFTIFILSGGRQIMATVILVVVLFLIFDKRIKSKFMMSFLGLMGVFAGFLIFQGIFEAILLESQKDANMGEDYTRLKAAEFFLTDFMKSNWAYITGNGMYLNSSNYGKEIAYNMVHRHYVLGDVGLIGNYALYGLFFVVGVFITCFKALRLKIESNYIYLKLMFITMILSMLIAGGFAHSDTICFVVLMVYIIDVSHNELREKSEQNVSLNK